jgi:hypothetical protein
VSGAVALTLSALDARVLRATDPLRERTAARVAGIVGCSEDVASAARGDVGGGRRLPSDWVAAHPSR